LTAAALTAGLVSGLGGSAAVDPPATGPGGPCIEPDQQVRVSSVPSYGEVVRQLRSIESSSQGAVDVASAGQSGHEPESRARGAKSLEMRTICRVV
jgi:hypothetical protein